MIEQDDGPVATETIPFPFPISPGQRFMEKDGNHWNVLDWTREYCRCYGMYSGEVGPRADLKCKECQGTGEGDWSVDPVPVAEGLSEDDARLLVFGRSALEAVLLFHSGEVWDEEARRRWKELTGEEMATTKSLCRFVRKSLGRAEE